jgi:hypothetical protein
VDKFWKKNFLPQNQPIVSAEKKSTILEKFFPPKADPPEAEKKQNAYRN